jgi:hypothetical protein
MVGGRARAGAGEYAQRVNAAVVLLESRMAVAEVARTVAARFGCSVRQARRYAERAMQGGPVQAPPTTIVFTVKLPAELVARVRTRARESGRTISSLVAQALEEFLSRGHRQRPRR